MSIEEIIKLITIILSFIVSLGTCLIFLIKNFRKLRATKDLETKANIYSDINEAIKGFITNAEKSFKEFDATLKAQGKSGCGAMKKDNVMTKVQNLCYEKGINFDNEYWDKQVEELVKLTKEVNSK